MSPALRSITARQFVSALLQEDFVLVKVTGSHHHYKHTDGRRVTVPYHQLGSTFAPGTLKSMCRQASWTKKDLKRLGLIK